MRADAYGMMILPSGDTLRNVLRTRTIQTIRQVIQSGDNGTTEQTSSIEIYKWYSKGYRYPIFETVRTSIRMAETEIVNFETAFFFPPQEHYYLDDDLENLTLLENDANEEQNAENDVWAEMTYNIFPNPVKTTPLQVEIYLPIAANVRLQVSSTEGQVVLKADKGYHPAGIYNFQVDMVKLPVRNYALTIWLNEKVIKGIVMKR